MKIRTKALLVAVAAAALCLVGAPSVATATEGDTVTYTWFMPNSTGPEISHPQYTFVDNGSQVGFCQVDVYDVSTPERLALFWGITSDGVLNGYEDGPIYISHQWIACGTPPPPPVEEPPVEEPPVVVPPVVEPPAVIEPPAVAPPAQSAPVAPVQPVEVRELAATGPFDSLPFAITGLVLLLAGTALVTRPRVFRRR